MEQATAAAVVVRAKPFQMTIATDENKKFTLEFRGLVGEAKDGEVIEVHLEFPDWWADVLLARLMSIAKGKVHA